MLRSQVDAAAVLAAMRAAAARIDPLVPVAEPAVMSTLSSEAQAPQRMGAMVSALFAASGLLLAALGTYGVLAYLVSTRTREFGIRQALGARPWDLHLMVLRDGCTLAAAGVLVGGALSAAAVRALQSVTTEAAGAVPAALPWIVAAVLLGAAVVASVVPARRATRTSPADVMRSE